MSSLMRCVMAGAMVCLAVPAAAQGVVMTPVPAPARAVDAYIRTVGDLDRSFAFYRDVVGLPVTSEPGEAAADQRLQRLTDTAGASLRFARLELPGTDAGLLLAEFSGVEREPQRPRRFDPGVSTLVLTVRDLSAALAAIRASDVAAGELAVTPDGRAAVVADPDGFFVEVVQADPSAGTPAGEAGNVVGTRLAFVVEDPEPVVGFYRDVLGFAVTRSGDGRPTVAPVPLLGDGGAPGEDARSIQLARIPGSTIEWEFVTWRGLETMAHQGRPQDPGTAAVSVFVPDVGVAAGAVRALGLPIVSEGGAPVMREDGGAVFVRDPGGTLLELIERR